MPGTTVPRHPRWLPWLAVLALGAAPPAHAVDGCRVLLCLAGHWRDIGACRGEVSQALRDIARGRAWPSCSFASAADNNARPQPAYAPGNCPDQYVEVYPGDNSSVTYACRYSGVIDVTVAGQRWSRVWWDLAGNTSTEYAPVARVRLGDAIDPTFDRDLAAWQRVQAEAAAAAALDAANNGGSN